MFYETYDDGVTLKSISSTKYNIQIVQELEPPYEPSINILKY